MSREDGRVMIRRLKYLRLVSASLEFGSWTSGMFAGLTTLVLIGGPRFPQPVQFARILRLSPRLDSLMLESVDFQPSDLTTLTCPKELAQLPPATIPRRHLFPYIRAEARLLYSFLG
jgi:hypothetical protein